MAPLLELRHGGTTARIQPLGAELRSLRVGSDEYLWQDESHVWPHSAPLLFPHVGRLRNGGFRHEGRWYEMGTHGFAATSEFEVRGHSGSAVRLELRADAATRASYPFEFRLSAAFELAERALDVHYEVHNEGPQPMHFGLGSHPAFALGETGVHEDWSIEFDEIESGQAWRLEGPLLAREPEALALERGRELRLTPQLFDRDALIFKRLRSSCIRLLHRERGERLRLLTQEAPHLGLWAKPGARYVCIEPWFGCDEDAQSPLELADKPELVTLAAGDTFKTGYRLEL